MRRLSSLAVAGATLAGSAVLIDVGPADAAVQADCQTITQRTTRSADITGPSTPYTLLGMDAATLLVGEPDRGGEPVRVAVLDTGVRAPLDGGFVVREAHPIVTGDDGIVDNGGTEVAGLVAGARRDGDGTGFAPHAEIVDVQVGAVRDDDGSGQSPATTASLTEGLDWVAANAKKLNIKVATVAFVPAVDEQLREAVEQVQQADVVVVAATGDPDSDAVSDSTEEGQPGPQQDAASDNLLPALPGVVAVNTTGAGAGGDTGFAPLPNSDTAVAVPSADAVTYAINGRSCRLVTPTTSAATGEVAGIVALLWERFPQDEAPQIAARLINTASGTTDDPTPLTGYGIVQPLDALTRPVDPAPDGEVERTENVAGADGPVSPPGTQTDLLAVARDDAVWWGLVGGGLLVVALLVRPVLARRR